MFVVDPEPADWDIVSGVGLTALAAAAMRAMEGHQPEPLVRDPYAAAFVQAAAGQLPGPVPLTPEAAAADPAFPWFGMAHYMAVRSRFFDDFFAAARSRRRQWRRVTGWAGRWLIPDYASAAADWDAVHVTVAGYLTTAGTAIPAGDGARTMLAGWDPDATWWLNDVLSHTSPPEDWREDDHAPFGWTQAPQR